MRKRIRVEHLGDAIAASGVGDSDLAALLQSLIPQILQTDPQFGTAAQEQALQAIVKRDGDRAIRLGDLVRIHVEDEDGRPTRLG